MQRKDKKGENGYSSSKPGINNALCGTAIAELIQEVVQLPSGPQCIEDQLEEGLANVHVMLDCFLVVPGDIGIECIDFTWFYYNILRLGDEDAISMDSPKQS